EGLRNVAGAPREALRSDVRRRPLHHRAQIHELLLGGEREREELLVQRIEALGEPREAAFPQLFGAGVDGQYQALPAVTQIGLILRADLVRPEVHALEAGVLGEQRIARAAVELFELGEDGRRLDLAEAGGPRP